ncbi:MAG: methyltransferase [Pseudomonadota bacterium]
MIGALRRTLVAKPAFRRLAERVPGLRMVANSSANDLFALTSGFMHSQVLLALAELDAFDRLSTTPASTQTLAAEWSMPTERAGVLLRSARALRLLFQNNDGEWALDADGIVIAQTPGILAMIHHHRIVYEDLRDPVALLRAQHTDTKTARFWSYVEPDHDTWGTQVGDTDANAYSELMRLSQAMVIEQVLSAYPVGQKHARLMDVGGGNGAFVTAAAAQSDALHVDIFDLPAVAENAKTRLSSAIPDGRLTVHGGSFFETPVPDVADCYSLIRVLYDHNDAAALAILKNIRNAMKPGDTLLIGEPMAGDRRSERLVQAYFGFYLLAMQSGKCRTLAELSALARKAGFARIRKHTTALPVITGALSAQV